MDARGVIEQIMERWEQSYRAARTELEWSDAGMMPPQEISTICGELAHAFGGVAALKEALAALTGDGA